MHLRKPPVLSNLPASNAGYGRSAEVSSVVLPIDRFTFFDMLPCPVWTGCVPLTFRSEFSETGTWGILD